jgi:predicted alpha-1,2-mannosidase
VEVRVGTSFISWEQAEQNLRTETLGGFDSAHSRARAAWSQNLGEIEIDASEDQKRTFYSCLYRAQMFPRRLYELNQAGKPIHYSPYDGGIHDGVLYGDIGIWDAFRTTFPLITILYPSQLDEILQGFVNASEEGGTLPEWPSPGYRDCMIGEHCAAIFADAVVKGVTKFNVAAAYQSLKKSAFEPPGHGVLVRRGLADYMKLGYIPDRASTYALSATLDYAYDDWCVAQIAKQQDQPDVFESLMKRSRNYRFLWDPAVGFMRPKTAEGQWVEPFDEFAWGGAYAESGPWQSSWFVPHDPAGLIGLIGGPVKMAAKLDAMLATPPTFHVGGYGHVIHEMTEMAAAHFGQYAQSNQPSFDNLYLFTAAGQPWKTEYWTRRVCAEMYNSSPTGFPGDEDNGSTASWYILSSMGLYPFCPGTPTYMFTSPLFSKITLHLPDNKTFLIQAPNNNDNNVYVQSRKLNDVNYTPTGMPYADIMRGGVLDLEMGPDAQIHAVEVKDLPYSATPYQ